jgi:hypothetical protein
LHDSQYFHLDPGLSMQLDLCAQYTLLACGSISTSTAVDR